jgi:hypothetical protein
MTIKPAEGWGRVVDRPANLVTVADDATLATRLDAIRRDPTLAPVAVSGGDLARTVGGVDRSGVGRSGVGRPTVNELPIDLLTVRLGGRADPVTACAHVVARSPWWRGSWLRGSVLVVMNAEFLGSWDVAPRGHPNDGRVEVLEAGTDLTLRQRLAARKRLRTATHIPHPAIATRSVRQASWTFPKPMAIAIDGRRCGRTTTIDVTVTPDAAIVHV